MHQCALFSAYPRQSHTKDVNQLVIYLEVTKDKDLILDPKDHLFECWADADFTGNWFKPEAQFNSVIARSQTGFIITYASCHLIWTSTLQVPISLSTTEAKYVALSTAMRELILLIKLMADISKQVHGI